MNLRRPYYRSPRCLIGGRLRRLLPFILGMPKPPEKKPAPPKPPQTRVLPMDLRIDRLVDERREWRVVAKPYTTAGARPRARGSSSLANHISMRFESGARTSA